MRTTLTLDADVARLLEEEAHWQRKPFKQVVNEAIRRGLSPQPSGRPGRYRVRPHQTAVRPGIDAGSFNKLADELEDEAVVGKMRIFELRRCPGYFTHPLVGSPPCPHAARR